MSGKQSWESYSTPHTLAESLQQLDELGKEGAAKFHFVDYVSPSFVIFRNRICLQITLRNPRVFDVNAGSIYKRAAQSFDLFLAGQLKEILERVPADVLIEGLDSRF